jgi:ferritin-like metal-binding protein YciE
MPAIDTLHELLKHELKDLYSAETQIIEALPEMVEAAADRELKKALQQHLEVTKAQKQRLEEVQKLLGEENTAPESKGFFANLFKSSEGEEHCKAMEGLVKEGNSLLKEDMTAEVMDAAIIAAAQKIEHYEISSYGTARAYALQLELGKVASLLEQTLKEEYEADDSLTSLALSKVNVEAEPKPTAKAKAAQPAAKAKAAKPAAKKVAAKTVKKAQPKSVKKAAPKKAAPKKSAAKSQPQKVKSR